MIARIVRKTKFFVALKKKILNPELRCNKFRAPRLWSNSELRKFAPFFTGSVVNISGWNDSDKEGNKYRDYFSNASEYSITNYIDDAERGAQGFEGEIKLNLEEELPENLFKQYDVAFTHTVL